jgi:drug/metabolite transporter (DMT)-like permease
VYAWTLRSVPAGLGALFFALVPLWMAFFGFVLYDERLTPLAALGLMLGLAGMIFLYSPSGAQGLPLWPTVIGFVSSIAWAFGAMIQRNLAASDVVQLSAMQMLVAAVVLAVMAAATREHLAVAQFTAAPVAALAYLIVFGSIVGFSAFLWL